MFETIINYLKYSGASVTITINPWHWNIMPRYFRNREWGDEMTHSLSWLFLTIRFWIDDGSW
jgi:hypothetical protein